MRKNCLFSLILSLAVVGGASAQCSGPAQRTALINLQKANEAEGTRAGQIPLTDTCGNQRYAQYVEINLTPIGYQPTTTGNTLNLSEFVVSTVDTGLYYIDWQGNAIKFAGMGGGGTCDVDWLEIGSNTCPDAITDSIYTQKYVAVGARYVWPTAELLVSDSVGVGTVIISGNRNARLGFYDNVNEVWSTIDQSGSSTIWYFDPNGEMRFVTAGGGTPQAPGAPFVNQFAIDPNDTPLPTIQAYLYPNTRTDTNTVRNFLYTDPAGKIRSQSIDSLAVILVDSGLIVNIYNSDGTTTDETRTVTLLEGLNFVSDAEEGYLYAEMGSLGGGRLFIDPTQSWLYYTDLGGTETVRANTDGIDIITSNTASRAVDITTDTVNLVGSFDADNFRINFLSENSYLFADSLKVVAIGQFPAFPGFVFDGTEKGFYYSPANDQIFLLHGDGVEGGYAYIGLVNEADIELLAEDKTGGVTEMRGSLRINPDSRINYLSLFPPVGYAPLEENIIKQVVSETANYIAIGHVDHPTLPDAFIVMGVGSSGEDDANPKRKFAIETPNGGDGYLWLEVEIPAAEADTTEDEIKFYNGSYFWQNARPSPTLADTSFHFWAGTGTDTEPGFMTLDDIRGGGGVNIYNSDGTTTDNARIADVLETLTFRSADVTVDGVYPFRFELDGVSPNEPEMMVWKFPSDSATLYQSDQELTLRSTTQWLFRSDAQTTVWADSFFYLNQGVGAFTITRYNKITQGSVSAQGGRADYLANSTITGVSQTELFLDGTSALLVVPANTNFNFEIHISAICSTAGNGVGITTGDAWESWHVGGIKRIGGTTSLVGTVQLPASAQSDAGMSTSVVTIDADDTDDSLRLRFTPPSTAGTTTVLRVIATISVTQISY